MGLESFMWYARGRRGGEERGGERGEGRVGHKARRGGIGGEGSFCV